MLILAQNVILIINVSIILINTENAYARMAIMMIIIIILYARNAQTHGFIL